MPSYEREESNAKEDKLEIIIVISSAIEGFLP